MPSFFLILHIYLQSFFALQIIISMSSIRWSPRDGSNCAELNCTRHERLGSATVHPPIRNIPVEIVVKGRDRTPRIFSGTLYPSPDQKIINIVVMDSLGQNFKRPANVIFSRHHGAKIEELVQWVRREIPNIKKLLPFPVRVILMGGSNNITTRELSKFNFNEWKLADFLVNTLIKLDAWCVEQHVALAISNVIPRPFEVDNHFGINKRFPDIRIKLSKSFMNVNHWIEAYNMGHEGKLPLSKFVEYVDRIVGRTETGEPLFHKRLYPKCPQRRVILSRFKDDLIHLSEKGEELIEKALLEFIES